MSRGVPVSPVRVLPRIVVAGLMASTVAACSPDATRFAQNPFSNPFASGTAQQPEPTMTGSVAPAQRSVITSEPLAPIAAGPQVVPAPAGVPAAPVRYATPMTPIQPSPSPASGPAGWTAQGGTAITVGEGETVPVLANRYGIPASALLSANGLQHASQVKPGTRLTIPVYNAAQGRVAAAVPSAAAAPLAAQQARPVQALTPNPRTEQPRLVLTQPKPVAATPTPAAQAKAKADAEAQKAAAKAAADRAAAAKASADKAAADKAAAAKLAADKAKQQAASQPARTAALAPVEQPKAVEAPRVTEQPKAAARQPEPEDQTASIAREGTEFRWPARGRIIAGFNGKGGNEGINIALPEGTPVKATEGGTVAYSGSELKGYGNLVLIRHDNGFVSAYAHNGELLVKRGEKVKRGQTIAKSGQTGNVSSPQLHFELRKGSTPVDPIQHLSGL